MKLIRKFKREILLGIFLLFSYFLLRLIYLNSLPMFTDEAIYVRWAQIALHDSSWRFISLTDGKQPMYIWVAMLFIKFIKDPLIAGRLVSVFTGLFTMVGLFFLSFKLFKSKTISFLTSIFYIAFPFAVVLDRMAIYDSMVAAFYVWALYFSITLVRKIRLDNAFILGFIIGGGVLTKTSNFFSIYLMPFILVLFDFKQKKWKYQMLKFILLAAFSAAIGYGFYQILRLSPLFEMISAKNATFVYPVSEWIKHPFTFFWGNLHGLTSWLLQYLTPSFIVLIVISLIFIKKFIREKLILLIFFLLPFLALALFGKLIYPRFIFLMTVCLLPLAAWGLKYLFDLLDKKFAKNIALAKISKIILLILVIIYPVFVSFTFAVDPVNAKIADADEGQYVNSWAAGWGVKESVAYFTKQAENQKIYIATEGTFGLMPESMEIYLINNKNITIKGYWPISTFPQTVENMASKMPTYFIFYQHEHEVIPPDYPLKLIFQVKQGKSNNYYRVYQVMSK